MGQASTGLKRPLWAVIGIALLSLCGAAQAQTSTTTYSYDALGRLIETKTTGGQTDGQKRTYQYDPAGNRTQLASTGAPNSTPPPQPPTLILVFNGHFAAMVQR